MKKSVKYLYGKLINKKDIMRKKRKHIFNQVDKWVYERTQDTSYNRLQNLANQGEGLTITQLAEMMSQDKGRIVSTAVFEHHLKDKHGLVPYLRWINPETEELIIVKKVKKS